MSECKDGVCKVDPEPNGWEVGTVRCSVCGHKWVAVRPAGTEKLECPKCHAMS